MVNAVGTSVDGARVLGGVGGSKMVVRIPYFYFPPKPG